MKIFFALLSDAVFVTRPIILIPVWGFFYFGYYRACIINQSDALTSLSLFNNQYQILLQIPDKNILITLVMFTLLMASSFIFNQIRDIKTDTLNDGIPIIAKGGYPRSLAITEGCICTIIPLIYSLFIGSHVAIFFFSAFFLSIVYNVKPFYFSGKPFLDFLTNGIGFGFVAFGIGWISVKGYNALDFKHYFLQALPYFLGMSCGSIGSTIPDETGDRETGKITTFIYLGRTWANLLSIILLVLALIFSMSNSDFLMIIMSAVSLPLFIKYQITGNRHDGIVAFQICGGIMMFLVLFIFPWFLAITLPVYIGTKLYFKFRHNINYPKIG